jgi:adenylosuccinate lyase
MDKYESPLSSRYGSEEMRHLFSADVKYKMWRELWIALATAQKEMGLDITDEQIGEMEQANLGDIDYEAVAKYEAECHHDVMAHIRAFGDVAPSAKPIIHLGATSQFVVDNADFQIQSGAIECLRSKLLKLRDTFIPKIKKYADVPCLGYTHFQVAQPTTVGKRFVLWYADIVRDAEQLNFQQGQMEFRGAKGTTGTQASFLALLGSGVKVKLLDQLVAAQMGCIDNLAPLTGQTYSRKIDVGIANALAGIAITAHKICNDIRLLSHTGEICESFGTKQVGSSAMAYKRNPIKCEQTTSLARYLMNLAPNLAQTAAEQWLERSLDDSANRRLAIPEAFILADAILNNLIKIIDTIVVNEATIEANLNRELPFMATENIIMAVVKAGGDRQEAHEKVREHSMAARENLLKIKDNDLLDRLKSDSFFNGIDIDGIVDIKEFVGLAAAQTIEYITGD